MSTPELAELLAQLQEKGTGTIEVTTVRVTFGPSETRENEVSSEESTDSPPKTPRLDPEPDEHTASAPEESEIHVTESRQASGRNDCVSVSPETPPSTIAVFGTTEGVGPRLYTHMLGMKSNKIRWDLLASYVWRDDDSRKPRERCHVRTAINRANEELERHRWYIDWFCEGTGEKIYFARLKKL